MDLQDDLHTPIPEIAFHLVIIIMVPLLPILHLEQISGIFYFLLIFLIVGRSVRSAFLKSLDKTKQASNPLAGILIDIILSMTITSIVLITLGLARLIGAAYLVLSIITLSSDTYSAIMRQKRKSTRALYANIRESTGEEILHLSILVLGGLFMVVWRFSYLVWPEVYGTDIFAHVAVTEIIINNGGTSVIFGTYPYIWHEFVASIALTCGLQSYMVIGYGPLITSPSVLIVTYLFLRALTENNRISLLGALFTGFVNESGALLGPQYAYPSIYAFAATLVILAALKTFEKNRQVVYISFFSISVIFMVYPNIIFGTLTSFLFIGVYFQTQSDRAKRLVDLLFKIGIGGCIGLFVAYYGILPLLGFGGQSISFGVAQLLISPTLTRQLYILSIAYSIPQCILIVFGFVSLLTNYRKSTNPMLSNFDADRFIILTVSLYTALFFSPFDVALRVEMYVRPLLFLCMVIGATYVLERINRIRKSTQEYKHPLHKKLDGKSIVTVFLLIIISIAPTVVMMDSTYTGESYRPNPDEYRAFEWLKTRIPLGGYVLTDPATGLIMRAYTLRNCSTSFIEEERTSSPLRYTETYERVFTFMNSRIWLELEAYDAIEAERKSVTFIVISPRTSAWLSIERSGKPGIYAPYKQWLQDDDPALSKFDGPEYESIIEFGELRILQRRNIAVQFNEQFDNDSIWETTLGNNPYVEQTICHWYNPSHPTNWFWLYSSYPSIDSSDDLYVKINIRSNTSGVSGWIVTTSEDDVQGNRSWSDWIYPSTEWQTLCFRISDFNNYVGLDYETIGLALTSAENNWLIEIDFIVVFTFI